MKQLLMRWTCTPIEIPAVPAPYRLHQYHRGGDAVLSEDAYRAGWCRSCEFGFEGYYKDMRIPEDGFFVILDEGGDVVATATVQLGEHTPDSGTLHMVGTQEAHRGKKFGRIVTVAVMDYIQRHGIKTMYLTTDDFRIPAIRLYLDLGCIPVLWDVDMRARWMKLLDVIGRDSIPVYDEQEQLTVLTRADT